MSVNTLDDYINVSIGGFNNCKSDTVIVNGNGAVVFISLLAYNSIINAIKPLFNMERIAIYTNSDYYYSYGKYEIITKKTSDSDYIHMIAYSKDIYSNCNNYENFLCHIFTDEEHLDEELYKCLTKYSSVPVLREWMPFVKSELRASNKLKEANTIQYSLGNRKSLVCHILNASRNLILNIVKRGLERGLIDIEGSNQHSTVLDTCTGLDNYLQLFGEGLAKKIQESFRPKFIPGEDSYGNYLCNIDDYVYYNAGINLYEAQRSTIQAIVNNMYTNKNTFLVGEMGAGKTLISAASCYVHNANKNKGFNTLIMCPSHLVNNWKNEIARFIPNSRSYIIHNLEELLAIKSKLTDPYKVENSFVILSKECAKIGYSNRPAVLFRKVGYYKNENKHRVKAYNVFVCPECGQVLTKTINVPYSPGSSRKVKRVVPMELTDFTKETNWNTVCTNEVKVYNNAKEMYETVSCGNKLWTAANRDDEDTNWIKLGKSGWVHKDTMKILINIYGSPDFEMTRKDAEFYDALTDQYDNIKKTGKADTKFTGTKKYPIASYIKKRMPGIFDYGIFDEIQNYKGKTEQGHAFHILAQSCKKTINCTGTLMNGYVNSMYYLLYRLLPESMIEEGYKYEDENEFNKVFGVSSTTYIREGYTTRKKSTKLLPGISSLVFTKFLLNNTVFISLEDMTEGLPNYEEIPYGIEMDETTAEQYRDYKQFMRTAARGDNKRFLKQYCRHMLTLPDAPHCMEDEVDEKNKLIYAVPTVEEFTTNKDLALLDIINAKITAGEKVLVYYNDVGTTNLGDHIKNMLNASGYKAAELKSTVKAEKREAYINNIVKSGHNVLICNPSLVETGLNLLDFTTIVFYQLGYNLNTMRQASRRSWRLSQDKDITVYFLYYLDTSQETTLSLMATKLHAAQSMEGKFSEEGLRAMSDNQDVLTQIASNVVDGIKNTVDQTLFKAATHVKQISNTEVEHVRKPTNIEVPMDETGRRRKPSIFNRKPRPTIPSNLVKIKR